MSQTVILEIFSYKNISCFCRFIVQNDRVFADLSYKTTVFLQIF